jgi:hypothetical protein
MIDANSRTSASSIDPANGTLIATDKSGTEYVLLRGVEKFEIKFEPMKTPAVPPHRRPLRPPAAGHRPAHRPAPGNRVDVDETRRRPARDADVVGGAATQRLVDPKHEGT